MTAASKRTSVSFGGQIPPHLNEGLRLGEVIRLKVEDVDLVSGILTINQGKFGKDRLVPMTSSLIVRLQL